MKILSLFLGLMISGMGWTASFIDKHCQPIGVKNSEALLKVAKPSLIILQNTSDHIIWLTHPVKDPGASAGWTSELSSKRWSALYMSPAKSDFNLACIESTPGHEQHISCADVLKVCILTADVKPENANGTFWAVENIRKKELMAALAQRGFEWSMEDKP